jgi:flagellar FliL protein
MDIDDGEDDAAEAAEQASKRKLIAVATGSMCLVAVAFVTTAFFDEITGFFARLGAPPPAERTAGPAPEKGPYYYDLPEVLVSLTNTRPASVLKLRVSLELASERETPSVEARMPYILDNFQTYLRELRVPDLKGSEGLRRLQQELLVRVTAVTAPAKVETLLFREVVIQ